MKQEILLDRGASRLNLDAESFERCLDIADGRLRRPLCGKLCRMHLEDAARLGKGLDIVAVKIEQVGNQSLQRTRAQARYDRSALWEGLQHPIELHFAQGLADVPAPDPELRRELPLRWQAIARL